MRAACGPDSTGACSARTGVEKPGRIEELELGRLVAENGPCDEVAGREAEDVAVARIRARHPESVASGDPACERQQIRRLAPDPGPPVRDARQSPEQVGDEFVKPGLDDRRRLLSHRLLGIETRVALASDDEPAVRKLPPVVVTVAGVMRALVEPLGDRL